MHTVCVLYSCPVSESSNYKLGRLDKRKFTTHSLTDSLTDSPTPLLEPQALQAAPGLKICFLHEVMAKKKIQFEIMAISFVF